jgi:hypothetical protein
MSNTFVNSQVVIGPYEVQHYTLEEVLQKLQEFHQKVGLRRLMIWNTQGEEWYQALVDACRRNEIEPYLWFPVLADWPEAGLDAQGLVCSPEGYRGMGKLGRWGGFESIDEDFLFLCPSRLDRLEQHKRYLSRLVSRYDFSGIFLDRIRFPSPANGLEMLFGCSCSECKSRYAPETLLHVKKGISLLEKAAKQGIPLSWENFLRQSDLVEWARDREHRIALVVRYFAESFRKEGLVVGLDLFSPSIAPLVGQDYGKLSVYCDWIKPMTYCRAIGPAGLPLEFSSFINGLVEKSGGTLSIPRAVVFVENLLGLPDGILKMSLPDSRTLPATFATSETLRARGMVEDTEIIPGIELVEHPQFSVSISDTEAEAYFDALSEINSDFIACWNLLYIPERYTQWMKRF